MEKLSEAQVKYLRAIRKSGGVCRYYDLRQQGVRCDYRTTSILEDFGLITVCRSNMSKYGIMRVGLTVAGLLHAEHYIAKESEKSAYA